MVDILTIQVERIIGILNTDYAFNLNSGNIFIEITERKIYSSCLMIRHYKIVDISRSSSTRYY